MFKTVTTAIVLSSLSANADVLTATQRFFGMGGQYPDYLDDNEETPASVLDQAPYSPADSDLGVQEIFVERAQRAPVVVDFSTAILRTDNAPSANPQFPGAGDQSSWVSASSFSVGWRPHLVQGWFSDLKLGQDILRYDRSNAVDFENFNLRLGVYKILPDLDDTIFFARYEYQRITTTSFGDSDYNAQRIRAGFEKVLWAAPRHQVLSTISGTYEWTAEPALLERNELTADITYRYSITDSLYTLASARVSRFNYDQFGRDDTTIGLALELIWQFNDNFRANASIFFDQNESDTFGVANEYQTWTSGLGVGAQWTF